MWGEQRPFSRAEAFLDLVHQAAHAPPSTEVTGRIFDLEPGEVCTSLRLLSMRWRWSTTKIRSFLSGLESEHLIERMAPEENTGRADNPPTIIKIRKFNRFRVPPTPPEVPAPAVKNTPPEKASPPKKEKTPEELEAARWARMSQTVKNSTRIKENSPLMVRIGAWFGQKPTTLWTIAEAETLARLNPPEDEIELMEEFYLAVIDKDDDIRRRAVITMLNNWRGETQKAIGWKADNL